MSAIRIGIINPSQSEKTNISAPDDVKVGEVVGDIVEALQLPVNGPNGRPNRYQLNLRQPDGRLTRLDEGQTLSENGVHQDAILQLTVEMVGGLGSRPTASFHRLRTITFAVQVVVFEQECPTYELF